MNHFHTTINKIIAFVGGSSLTSYFAFIEYNSIVQTAILGLVGGACGLLGKDLYNYIKSKAKEWN